MTAKIDSGASVDSLTISTQKSANTTIYTTMSGEAFHPDHEIAGDFFTTSDGFPIVASANEKPILLQTTPDGSLSTTGKTLHIYDAMGAAAVNTNKWIATSTTMTQTLSAGILTLNSAANATAAVGTQILSHKFMLPTPRGTLIFRCKARHTLHYFNNIIELGFGSPATAVATSIGNGACWRKTGSGQYTPVISVNGSEVYGSPVDNNLFENSIKTNEFAEFAVVIKGRKVSFSIAKITGELVFFQTLELPVTLTSFTATRLQAMARTYNGGATAVAVQVFLTGISVWSYDVDLNKPWSEVTAGMSHNAVTSPTAFTQLETYTNNVAPTTATPTNTTAVVATLGGLSPFSNGANSFAASDTLDLIIFGVVVPSPYQLIIKGIRIDAVNQGAASNAAIYTIQWFLAVNDSAVSLATAGVYPARRKVLGYQTLVGSAPIGTQLTPAIDVRFGAGLCVFPGRFVQIGARVIGASVATASQVIRASATIDGYFE